MEKIKIMVEKEVTGCFDCPYCEKVFTDAERSLSKICSITPVEELAGMYICKKGAYGEDIDPIYSVKHPNGYEQAPILFHPNCPINPNKLAIDALAFVISYSYGQSISYSQVYNMLKEFNLEVSFKEGE